MRNALLLSLIGLLAFSLAVCGCPKGDAGNATGTGPAAGPAGTVAAATAPDPTADDWVDYVCDDHGFMCRMPVKPTADPPETYVSGENKVTDYGYSCEIDEGAAAYRVQVTEVSEDAAAAVFTESYLEDQKGGIAAALGGAEITSESEIDAYGRTVLELEFGVPENPKLPEPVVYRTRLFVVGNRSFQLIATHTESADKPEHAKRFFDSFELVTDEQAEGGAEPAESAAAPAVGLAEEADES